jgi:OFA family oxalate/formate antiporter-like MFS transporter
MQRKSIGFGTRGTLLMVYQVLAYAGYTAFTNFPQNAMSDFYGGTQTTTLMNLIGGILGYLITYFIIAPRIGRIKNMKRVGITIGLVSLVFCALVCLIPPTMATLWCINFVLVLITTQLWACFFVTMLIGNWFPRRKGTVMGIVTIAFPIVTGICLNLFMIQFYTLLGSGASLLKASVSAFAPYWILSLVGMGICAIFLKDFPEQVGAFRDNDKSFTPEMANQMLVAEMQAREKSVWKRSKIWGCLDWWLFAIPNSLLLSSAIALMVQIVPVLMGYNEQLKVLAVPGFLLMSEGYSAVLFGLAIFATAGSWFLGVIDTRFGTRFAVAVTTVFMLLAGILGSINNVWCVVAACWLLGIYMGAASNFGLSGVVRYWRQEDFPSVFSGAPPLGTVIGAAFPFIVASIAARFTYNGAFTFIGICAIVAMVCLALFNPRRLANYDNKLREAAGLPADDVLLQRVDMEKRKKSTINA